MTQQQEQAPEQQFDLDPMAVYYRERLHNAMDENAIMRLQQQRYNQVIGSLQAEIQSLRPEGSGEDKGGETE